MWYSQFLIFILAFQVTRQESPFVKYKDQYDSYDYLYKLINNIDAKSGAAVGYIPEYLNWDGTCADMNSTQTSPNNYLLIETESLNKAITDCMTNLDGALAAGKEFHAASEIVLKSVNSNLNQIKAGYEKAKKLIEDLAEIKNANAYKTAVDAFVKDAMQDESVRTGEYKINEIMEHVHSTLFPDNSSHLHSQLLEYDESINRCSKYDSMQNLLYYSYLRLVGAEIQSFITIALANFWKPIGANSEDMTAIASNILFRLTNYMTLIRNTANEFNPKCECHDKNPLTQIKTGGYGEISEFYPVKTDVRNDNKKIIRFYTNVTQNICVHLSAGPQIDKILVEVCLSERLQTQNVIRKNNEIVKIENIDESLRFNEDKYRLLSLEWFLHDLTKLEVKNIKSEKSFDKLLTYQDESNDLSKVTHFALSFAHNFNPSFSYIENGPVPKVGFSPLIRGIKACYCPSASTKIEGMFYAMDPFDGRIFGCQPSKNDLYKCQTAPRGGPPLIATLRDIMPLQGCEPDVNPVIDPAVVTNQKAILKDNQVKFLQYCEISGAKGVYSPFDDKCVTFLEQTGDYKIVSI